MELVPIVLELPKDYATVESSFDAYDTWTFTGMTQASAMQLAEESGVQGDLLADLNSCKWTDAPTGCSVQPSDKLILLLPADVRAALYSRLMQDPANKSVISPTWFRVNRVDARLRGSGLSEESITLLKSLLYPGGGDTLLFNDHRVALRAIASQVEREKFLRAVLRKRAELVSVLIDADTDTQALADYWGRGGRERNVLPLLDAMRFNALGGVEEVSKLNITSLLPAFVSERLYRHADQTTPADGTKEDCFWTAFNFFCTTPDDRVQDMQYLVPVMAREYDRIDSPGQLGDVIILADAQGNAIHAANYIADDVVFTKNGVSERQPWILTSMKDLYTQYEMKTPKLTVGYFRKKLPS